jgi:hypothetical protein
LILDQEFDYLITKIDQAEICQDPFAHVYIENFFDAEHFDLLQHQSQINLDRTTNTRELIAELDRQSYSPEPFPGCTTDLDSYLAWYDGDRHQRFENDLLEGFGVAFRLRDYRDPTVSRLMAFLNSQRFHTTIKSKFGRTGETRVETAIQKYLTGYEISPHPDIRRKCLTYMININTDPDSETKYLHTHLLRFLPEYKKIYEFWHAHPEIDRCWVPWSWCCSEFEHTKNNSILMFAPNDHSLHAVKLNYDHTQYQRTQIYGNLWYLKEVPGLDKSVNWKRLEQLSV